MTLHWWMHWFWITTILLTVYLASVASLPTPLAAVRSVSASSVVTPLSLGLSISSEHQSLRNPKSIGNSPREPLRFPYPVSGDIEDTDPDALRIPDDSTLTWITPTKHKLTDNKPPSDTPITITSTSNPKVKEEISKYQLVINRTELSVDPVIKLNNSAEGGHFGNHTRDDLEEEASNRTNGTAADKETLTTASGDLVEEFSTDVSVSRASLATILAVADSRGPSSETMLGRASMDSDRALDPAAIAGISLGVLAVAILASAVSFVLYRRRYLNKPQTLSDKCSNPDSSGYIDDSTIRENSEEMYSLDNDSFLNSLEAMTIQNYWTDSVKHTKL